MSVPSKLQWLTELRGAELTNAEYRVLVTLATFTDKKGTNAFPGATKLADAARVSGPTLKSALVRLRLLGWIRLSEEGGNQYGKGKANVWEICTPKGVSELPPSVIHKGVNDLPPSDAGEGVNPPEQGGKSAPIEGGKPLTPHQVSTSGHENSSGGVSHVSNAHARAETPPKNRNENDDEPTPIADVLSSLFPNRETAATPAPDEPETALDWIGWRLPDGCYGWGERARAEQLLADGLDRNEVKFTILRERQRPERHCRRHRRSDPADIGPCVACKESRLAVEAWEARQAAMPKPDVRDCPDCDGNIWLDDNATRKCTHPNLPGWRSA